MADGEVGVAGPLLRRWRLHRQLTVREAAAAAQVPPSTWHSYERDHSPVPFDRFCALLAGNGEMVTVTVTVGGQVPLTVTVGR